MKLEKLVSQKGLVLKSPRASRIRERAREAAPDKIKLFYGETYDAFGNIIDSMKYYFFVAELAKSLKQEGFDTYPLILIADVAACRNISSRLEYKYMKLGESRASFVEDINIIYNTNLNIIRMSEYLYTTEFQQKLEEIINTCTKNPGLMKMIEKSVPESKLEIEKRKGFMYSFEEITTIIDLDIKVGPPREDLYDNIARRVAKIKGEKQVMSLFLTPTFPLGMNWAYFFANEGIEDHGITAYKAGSKGLQDHRILIGRSNPSNIRELIHSSFISTDPKLPNPILDIGIITEMARKRLENDDSPIILAKEFYSGLIKPAELKDRVSNDVENYILSRLARKWLL